MAYQSIYSTLKKNSKKIMVGAFALLSLVLLFIFSRSSFDEDKEKYLDVLKKYNSNLDEKHKLDIESRIEESKTKVDNIDAKIIEIESSKEIIESRRRKDEQLKDIANDLRGAGY